jgi:hypothetical protein
VDNPVKEVGLGFKSGGRKFELQKDRYLSYGTDFRVTVARRGKIRMVHLTGKAKKALFP